ncbi:MAG: hypothetical protein HY903_24580 [Deltaproteobacteria bacterium]|nr:hypothetical protein [Deltaproteobacteria bacterium]
MALAAVLTTEAAAAPPTPVAEKEHPAARKGAKGKRRAPAPEPAPAVEAPPPPPAVAPVEPTPAPIPPPAAPGPAPTPTAAETAAPAAPQPAPTGAAAARPTAPAASVTPSASPQQGNEAAATTTAAPAREIEVTDFAAEEAAADKQSDAVKAGAAGGGAFANLGFKLFLDLLADYRLGQEKWVFRPNHFYVLVQGTIADDLALTIHISENPVFYEVTWNLTPRLSLKAGKLLIPFGTNEFHHLIGGRVDERSDFLPETWGDFGVGASYLVYDGDVLGLEATAYAVNGFEGIDRPSISVGDAADNNMSKGLGTRLKLALFGKVALTGSGYYDVWDPADEHKVVIYSVGAELRPGLVNVPVLKRARVRGEWARAEIQLPGDNAQKGLLPEYAVGRGGYYGELLLPVAEFMALRGRLGRINPDNTARDEPSDVSVYEPALVFMHGKLTYTIAYQLVTRTGTPHRFKVPGDVIYAKFFLQY